MNELVTITQKEKIKSVIITVLVFISYSFLLLSGFLFHENIQKVLLFEIFIFSVFLIDYCIVFVFSYKKIVFYDLYIAISNPLNTANVNYSDIYLLREKKRNLIVLVSKKKKILILGKVSKTNSIDDKNKTVNIIREEIRKRTGNTIKIKYSE